MRGVFLQIVSRLVARGPRRAERSRAVRDQEVRYLARQDGGGREHGRHVVLALPGRQLLGQHEPRRVVDHGVQVQRAAAHPDAYFVGPPHLRDGGAQPVAVFEQALGEAADRVAHGLRAHVHALRGQIVPRAPAGHARSRHLHDVADRLRRKLCPPHAGVGGKVRAAAAALVLLVRVQPAAAHAVLFGVAGAALGARAGPDAAHRDRIRRGSRLGRAEHGARGRDVPALGPAVAVRKARALPRVPRAHHRVPAPLDGGRLDRIAALAVPHRRAPGLGRPAACQPERQHLIHAQGGARQHINTWNNYF